MMFYKYAIRLVIMGIVLGVAGLVWQHKQDEPRVFVIHSYNTDLSWVNSIDEGILAQLNSELPSAQVRFHYMDLKNHNGCNFRRRSTRDVLYGIMDWKPDYLLLVDDLAQELIGAHYLAYENKVFPEKSLAERLFAQDCPEQDLDFYEQTYAQSWDSLPQIVFAGVNYSVEPYGYFNAVNTQGIYEHKNFVALSETLLDLSRYCGDERATAVLPLNDNSPTARRELTSYRQFNWFPLELMEPTAVSTLAEWKQQVALANENRAMLLIANYQQVETEKGSKQFVPADQLIHWTVSHAHFPVLGAGTNFVDDGGMMTVAIAGLEQGKELVNLMKRPRQERTLVDSAVKRADQFLVGLAARKAKQSCDNRLPKIYQAYAKETGLYRFEEVSEVLYVEP
ncbi:hypothetical protein [Marinomonas mediterranea]|uniref:hypothetical protein n=1 Tax=Marinomonas mediterranea TaxID=119864 RepID=UPI00234A0DB4|nr:hypothetical protein [Marinomonas mediterranea]WCN09838.1 hypothetical protein GV055_13390 [Marinomonas mediterranea]